MSKVAVIVLADTETHEGLWRVVNALEATKDSRTATMTCNLFLMERASSGFRNWRSPITWHTTCLLR